MLPKLDTLQSRFAAFLAVTLLLAIGAFGVAAYAILYNEEASEQHDPKDPPEHAERDLAIVLLIGGPLAIAAAVLGSRAIARRALAKLDEIVHTIETLGTDNLSKRIVVSSDTTKELAMLIASFNSMLARLERSVGGLQRFTADASHELRTPIATLRSTLEVALMRPRTESELRTTVEGALEQLNSLGSLVEMLLTLARTDASALELRVVHVDLIALLKQMLEPYVAVMVAQGITLRFSAVGPVMMQTDPMWVARVVTNLVDNAVKFTPAGGTIEVKVSQDHNTVKILVMDNGPGIPSRDADRVFERFYRGSSARGQTQGFGLGLALARNIVEALGGRLELTPTSLGAHFTVEVPLG